MMVVRICVCAALMAVMTTAACSSGDSAGHNKKDAETASDVAGEVVGSDGSGDIAVKMDVADASKPDICEPNCEGHECGDDGCGSTCGTCPCEGCEPTEIDCSPNGQCTAPCDLCDCRSIFDCMSICDVPGATCQQTCLKGASIETQMAFNALMDCMGDNICYWFDECQLDPIEACPDEYYACFPPGDLDCEGIYQCLNECGADDQECVAQCLNEGSIEALNAWDEYTDCLDLAGYFECPEDDDACYEQAYDSCAAELNACLGCTPDCEGKQCGDDGCGGACGECLVECTAHDQCTPEQLCLSEESGGLPEMAICSLCGDVEECQCSTPTWAEKYACTIDTDCETNLMCGEQCDDCAPCPKCVHGWCAYETFEVVECTCTGCA